MNIHTPTAALGTKQLSEVMALHKCTFFEEDLDLRTPSLQMLSTLSITPSLYPATRAVAVELEDSLASSAVFVSLIYKMG